PYWPQSHSDVIRKVLSKARAGTIVTLIPGNHDEYLRRFSDLQLGNIMITREAVHRTADGRPLLILHGDDFDSRTRCHRWIVWLGGVGCEVLLALNRWFNGLRRLLGVRILEPLRLSQGLPEARRRLRHRLRNRPRSRSGAPWARRRGLRACAPPGAAPD